MVGADQIHLDVGGELGWIAVFDARDRIDDAGIVDEAALGSIRRQDFVNSALHTLPVANIGGDSANRMAEDA